MKQPTINDVSCLLTVLETGSFSAAAVRIGVRQSSVSMAISRLETQLDSKLLLRTKKGLILTETGQFLVGRGRAIIAEWDKMIEAISVGPQEIGGRFVIAAPPPVTAYSLARPVSEMMSKFPLLDFSIMSLMSGAISKQLHSFKCDLGILLNPLPDPKLDFHWLDSRYIGLWKVKDKKVAENVFIHITGMTMAQDFLFKAKEAGISFKKILEVDSIETIVSLVAAGAGIGLIPSLVAQNQKVGNFIGVQPKTIRTNLEVFLAVRKDEKRSFALSYIIDTLIADHHRAHKNPTKK